MKTRTKYASYVCSYMKRAVSLKISNEAVRFKQYREMNTVPHKQHKNLLGFGN